MHTVNLIASALRKHPPSDIKTPPGKAVEAVCAVTGEISPCYPWESLFGASFTNYDLLKAPDSRYVSADAWITFSYKWERMSIWFCDGEQFRRLERKNVREIVVNGVYPELWSAYVTTSYKKHGAFSTVVNSGRMAVWLFENVRVDCTDHALLINWWEILNEALCDGISRACMETLKPNSSVLASPGINRWLKFHTWAQPKFSGCLYQFLCYLLPSQEELKNAG
jgi:hypothetical protein